MPVTRNQSNAAAQARSSNEAAESSTSKDDTGEGEGEGSGEGETSRRDSPDNCSICLGPFNNKSFTSSCAHSFCFVCLKQWSKVKAECPLCKQPFTSIFHNIRSNQSYDIYDLPLNPTRQPEYNNFLTYGSFAPSAPFSHYLFHPPSLDADLTLSNFSRFQFRHRRNLHPTSIHAEHQYSFQAPAVSPSTHVSAATWPRGAEDFRREVYRRYLGPPAIVLGTENSNYILTPAMVTASAHRLHRIMPWLTRELRVLLRSHQNVRLAISAIQPLLTQVMIDSQYFRDRVSPFIGHKSQQFIQEFVAFANSAMNVQTYDRKAMYRRRDHNTITFDESSSNSSTDDDVVEVTDISPETPNPSAGPPPLPPPPTSRPVPTLSNLLQSSGWDSPTPGPSWENVVVSSQAVNAQEDRVSVSSEGEDAVFMPALHDSDSEDSKAGSDIVFVKYDKPWNERSPINLSSDSDGEDGQKVKKKKKSKHKKKRLPSPGSDTEVPKADKGHKSSKSKSKNKDKSKSRSGASGEEPEQESSSSVSGSKRRMSVSSMDRQKSKRHKKSKDRRERPSGQDRDRELVDKLFAEAILGSAQAGVSGGDAAGDKSSKSSDKERSKKKKKHKNRRQEDRSPLHMQSYKKHPSGHKKSSDPKRRNPGSHSSGDRSRHRHRSGSGEGELASTSQAHSSSQRGAYSRDPPVPLNPPQLSSSGFTHSVSSSFQAPYLPMPDTVQHIPLNLWVSTWPSLPVSHTFPPPPPPNHQSMGASPPHSSVPGMLSATATTNLPGLSRPPGGDSHTISSDSSSDSDDTDNTQDYQDASTESSNSHTQQWLEKNFPCMGASSTAQAVSATSTHSSTTAVSTPASRSEPIAQISSVSATQPSPSVGAPQTQDAVDRSDESLNVDVLSVPSCDEDEDVVICSSASSDDSDNEDVKVVDVEEGTSATTMPGSCAGGPRAFFSMASPAFVTSFSAESLAQTSASLPVPSLPQDVLTPQPCSSSTSSPLESGRFQPFKLFKKNPLTKQSVDPFFPSVAPNSEDEIEDFLLRGSSPSSSSVMKAACSQKDGENHDVSAGAEQGRMDTNTSCTSSLASCISSRSNGKSHSPPSGSCQLTAPSTSANGSSNGEGLDSTRFAPVNPFSTTEASSPLFPVLPPFQPPNPPVTSVLSSRLGYLPFGGISVSSSISPIIPPALPYGVTQPPPPPPLPLHFPFPPLPPMLTPPAVLPPLYPALSQASSTASATTQSALSKEDATPSAQVTTPASGGNISDQLHSFTPTSGGQETTTDSQPLVPSISNTGSAQSFRNSTTMGPATLDEPMDTSEDTVVCDEGSKASPVDITTKHVGNYSVANQSVDVCVSGQCAASSSVSAENPSSLFDAVECGASHSKNCPESGSLPGRNKDKHSNQLLSTSIITGQVIGGNKYANLNDPIGSGSHGHLSEFLTKNIAKATVAGRHGRSADMQSNTAPKPVESSVNTEAVFSVAQDRNDCGATSEHEAETGVSISAILGSNGSASGLLEASLSSATNQQLDMWEVSSDHDNQASGACPDNRFQKSALHTPQLETASDLMRNKAGVNSVNSEPPDHVDPSHQDASVQEEQYLSSSGSLPYSGLNVARSAEESLSSLSDVGPAEPDFRDALMSPDGTDEEE